MRRLLTLAAFLLIISLVPLCAQRGGRASGGSHGGFSGGHASVGGGHGSFGGSHSGFGGHAGFVGHGSGGPRYGGSHSGSRVGSHFGAGTRSFGRGDHFRGGRGDHFRRGRFRDHGFRNGCYGYGCGGYGYGYPLYAYGGIDPYWWWDSYSSYDADAAQERAEASRMNAENLDEQQRLREQDHDLYDRPANRPRDTQSRDERAQADPPTVLVFRDQHQREIHNYAIVGPVLWSFTPQRTEKIPLANLDIPATTKANEERGVDFRLPRASEGQ